MDSQYIADGRDLGYEGSELRDYVRCCKEEKKLVEATEREERRRMEDVQREERVHLRELRQMETEVELARLAVTNNSGNHTEGTSSKSFIKLSTYKDGDDVAVYLRTFEKVRDANCWSEKVAISALQNGFVNSKVCTFLNSLPVELPYDNVKLQIIQAFGFTIYDYENKFRNVKQGSESFRQFVLKLSDYFDKFCKLANVGDNYANLVELVIKDQIINSVYKELSEYLREKDLFHLSLDEVIRLSDNFQAIHGKNKPKIEVAISQSRPNASVRERQCFQCGRVGHLARHCKVRVSNYATHHVPSHKEDSSLVKFNNREKKSML